MKRRRVLLGIVSMGYGKLVSAVIQLALVPILASAWGLPLYGQWLLLSTIPVFLTASDFGFGSAAGNQLIAEVARGELDEALTTFQSAQGVILACSLAMLAAALAVCFLLPGRVIDASGGMVADETRRVLAVLCLYGVIGLQGGLFMAVMRSVGAFARSTTLEASIQLAEGLAVIAVVLLGGNPMRAALAYLVVRSIGVGCHVLMAKGHARWLRLGYDHARRAVMRGLLRPALAAMMLPLSQAGYLQGTALAVGAAGGAGTVPIFTALRTLSRVGLQLLMTINLPVLPEFTAEHARGNRGWLASVTGGMASLNLGVGLVSGLGMALLGNFVLQIWTKGAIQAPEAMILLSAVSLVLAILWNPLSNLLVAVNRHEKFTYLFALAAFCSVGLTFLFVRHWGLSGAALANLGLDALMFAIVFRQVRILVGPFPIGLAPIRALLPGGRR